MIDKRLRRAALASLAAALLLVPVAHADDGKIAPAGKVFAFLESFLKVPPAERARIKVTYGLRRDGQPATGVKAVLVEANGARTPLPIDAKGRFERLPTLAQLQGKANVVFDVPADTKFGTSMQLAPVLRAVTEYETSELEATVTESNAAIRKTAGAMAMMAPQMTGLTFAKAESGVVVFPNGGTQLLPVVDGAVVYRSGVYKGATRVRLAKTPTLVDFYDKKK